MGSRLCILGHHYQTDAVIRHCDFTGDSLELSRKVPTVDAEILVFCGVFFMGESAALLTRPDQKVYIPAEHAECMMALMAGAYEVERVVRTVNTTRRVIPLAYVNTQAGVKSCVGAYNGAVCTSANADIMLDWALREGDAVLFLPDRHLACNTAKRLGLTEKDWQILHLSQEALSDPALQEKRLLIWPGCCPVHAQLRQEQIEAFRKKVPDAAVYVHPECPPEVVSASDGAGSTSFLIAKAKEAEKTGQKLGIGTESNLVARLHKSNASVQGLLPMYCPDMNAVTEERLLTLLQAIDANKAKALSLSEKERKSAKEAITRMLTVCDTIR